MMGTMSDQINYLLAENARLKEINAKLLKALNAIIRDDKGFIEPELIADAVEAVEEAEG